jgi:FkbM family methyltransferase
MEIFIYGPDGERHALTRGEMGMFHPSFAPKLLPGCILLIKMSAKLDLSAISLMLRGGAKALMRVFGAPGRLLPADDLKRLEKSMFGFNPAKMVLLPDNIALSLEKMPFGDAMAHAWSIVELNQYSVSRENMKNAVVVDAGANIGIFSIYAARKGARKAYAFEPVRETCDILEENVRLNRLEKKIIPVNLALGEKKGRANISFCMAGDGCASIGNDGGGNRKQMVRITTIDAYMGGARVDFIKIDTEGYEAQVLKGAKNTIKRFKPAISFSVYHKADDRERLPKIVKKFRKDYKCAIHNYSEPDCYCD